MKFALIFLMAFVAVSQQFYLQRPNIPMVWLAPHPARYFMNNYRPLVASVVKCVPSFQVSPVPVSCGRKKRGIDQEEDDEEHHQYVVISPSETLKLTPTALPSETRELVLPAEQLTSSKDEVAEVSKEDQKRDKRFFLLNRNFYTTSTVTATSTSVIVIPTTTVTQSISTATAFATATSTSYVFSNSTITQTVNLISPAPTAQCKAASGAAGDIVCVACLPTGYVVCAASG